jgi:hypothetical protein
MMEIAGKFVLERPVVIQSFICLLKGVEKLIGETGNHASLTGVVAG